jgi:hypothetical protein
LYMEPGSEKEGIEESGQLHMHPHKHSHHGASGAPHMHRQAHSAPPTQGRMAGLFNFIAEILDRLRERLVPKHQIGTTHSAHIPISSSSADDEFELEPGDTSRTSRAYQELSKRRSML